MNCHYCLADAETHIEKDGIKIGICETHLQEKVEDFELKVTDEDLQPFI